MIHCYQTFSVIYLFANHVQFKRHLPQHALENLAFRHLHSHFSHLICSGHLCLDYCRMNPLYINSEIGSNPNFLGQCCLFAIRAEYIVVVFSLGLENDWKLFYRYIDDFALSFWALKLKNPSWTQLIIKIFSTSYLFSAQGTHNSRRGAPCPTNEPWDSQSQQD